MAVPTESRFQRTRAYAIARNHSTRWIMVGMLALGVVYTLFPVLWMLSNSFKNGMAVFEMPPVWIVTDPVIDNYTKAFATRQAHQAPMNESASGRPCAVPPRPRSARADKWAGLNDAAAQWVADKKPRLVGTDNLSIGVPGPFAAHRILMVANGIYVMKSLKLEEMSKDARFDSTVIVLPLKLKGGEASLVRPIALA